MPLTDKELKDYLKGGRKSAVYEKTVEIYDSLRIHADGEMPDKLIKKRRPNESDDVFTYRKDIYEPVTKETINSVILELGKIRRAPDYSIQYKGDVPASIAPDETLQEYCEKKFPYYNSLTNWAFSVLLKKYLIDPNALILVAPLNTGVQANEYLKPYPIIFTSDKVLEYREGDFALLQTGEPHSFMSSGQRKQGTKWHYVTDTSITTYAVINSKGDIGVIDDYVHGLGYLPVVKIRAVFKDAVDEQPIFESRISAMVPRLNKAVREDSDQDANVVSHMFAESWEYATQPCHACCNSQGIPQGIIQVPTGSGKNPNKLVAKTCPTCAGTKTVATSGPYKKFIVRPTNQNMGEQPVPTPPKGYITKTDAGEIIKQVDERIANHLYKALAAINMQFLDQTPLSQSGTAKEVDRDALNTFVYGVAEDVVYLMDCIYKIICDLRYGIIVKEPEKRAAMLPKVAVPERYDMVSSLVLMNEISAAKTAGVSPLIICNMQVEYASKKFQNNPEIAAELQLMHELDPMPGISADEKMSYYQNGGVTKQSYIVSCNIVPFVKKAMQADKQFMSKPYAEQMDVLTGYADEIIKANVAEVKKMQAVQPEGEPEEVE